VDPWDYQERLESEVRRILTSTYSTCIRDGVHPQRDRVVGLRTFWPEFDFQSVAVRGDPPRAHLEIRFTVAGHERRRYGYRVPMWDAVEWWERNGPSSDIRDDPELLAGELVWYMVCVIGGFPFDTVERNAVDAADSEPVWIDRGGQAFTPLSKLHAHG
jgi:hypothetical protein